MIVRLIEWAMRNRFLVGCATVVVVAFGVHAVLNTPVDAIPDLSENQVIVFADWPGRSPQEVEVQVTYPLSANLQGLAGVKTVRATSMFGFSLVTVILNDDVRLAAARQQILERLSLLGEKLPPGVQARLGPDATGLGWVYQYYLDVAPAAVAAARTARDAITRSPSPLNGERAGVRGGNDGELSTSRTLSNESPLTLTLSPLRGEGTSGYDLGELRALQDWFIRPQLNSVSGVAEVGSVGGFVKQYQIEVDPAKMRDVGVSLNTVMQAVGQDNLNVGGKTIEENGMEFVVRGVGLIKGASDLEKIVLMEKAGGAILLRDVARVQMGGDFRRGTLDVDGREVVGGIVVLRNGENARDVIRRVKARIAQLQLSLPDGVTIKPFYDRSELIERSLDTLKRALTEQIILVVCAHIILLWHFRSILIVTLPLPISILISFILMRQMGLTLNLMSLSGIAIAVGVLVDGAIVITENVIRQSETAERSKGGRLNPAESFAAVLAATKQVGRPIFFAMVIIVLAFVPVFALTGQEGKLFHPLAFAKTFAMIGATLLAVTLVPALCLGLVRGPFHSEERNVVMRWLLRIYEPALDFALRRRTTVMATAAMILACALVVAFGLPRAVSKQFSAFPSLQKLSRGLGKEFMPPLNEGTLLYMPTFLPAMSLTEVKRVMAWQDQIFQSFPEVHSAVGKLGRADTATDPAPVEMIETTITLKSESEWRAGVTRQSLIAELTEKLNQVPGSVSGFLQPIQGRVRMISTGIRAQLGVKLFGENLDELQHWAFEVEKTVRSVRGAAGVATSRVQAKPQLEIETDRDAMARYGLRTQEVLDVVEAGLGGKNVASVIEGRSRVPIQVRLQRSEREDLERIKDVLVTSATGQMVPLGQVATIKRVEGPDEIASENGRLRVFVQANVEHQVRDLGSFVEEVKARVDQEMGPRLPKGVTVEYSGEYENELHAARMLRFIVPVVFFIIFALLCLLYRQTAEAAHVIFAVPFALSGGVLLQWFLGIPFSVAVWVGYIALFGTAIQTSVVMVVYLDEAVTRKQRERGSAFNLDDLVQAVAEGAKLRLRPKVMTVATIVASLLPIMWSTRTGSEVMRPLAAPILGGMVSSLVHILIVTPAIFLWRRAREVSTSL